MVSKITVQNNPEQNNIESINNAETTKRDIRTEDI